MKNTSDVKRKKTSVFVDRSTTCFFIFTAVFLLGHCSTGSQDLITDITVHQICSGFDYCHKGGVKQDLGAYKNGLSIVQVSRTYGTLGNPDFICWVNEKTGRYGISKQPTGNTGLAVNPGGNVAFDEKGYIWYTYGGRSQDLAFDLYRSEHPYDCRQFEIKLDNFVTKKDDGSTSIKVFALRNKVILQWRQFGSTVPIVKARHRIYDMSDFSHFEKQVDIGTGIPNICIEQVWSRIDPRYNYLISSFHFFQLSPRVMGSAPFFYSNDFGTTWRMPDGTPYTGLPMDYSEASRLGVIPWDHIKEGHTSSWVEFESGISPNGKFWMICPTGPDMAGRFFLWDNKSRSWENTLSVGSIQGRLGGFSCGATKDKLLVVYTNEIHKNKLYCVVSADDGTSWSEAVLLDSLNENEHISWVSYCQPSTSYSDNFGRFFFAYYDSQTGNGSQNNIKFVRFKAQ